jgi:hypothetical protein
MFLVYKIVLDNSDGTGHFLNKSDSMEDILKSPLARELFKIDGIKAVCKLSQP